MAFSVTANPLDILPISLTDGNPFRIENADILMGAPTVRHQQRSPLQDGMSDLGFRLLPREMELSLLFTAATDAALDGHRDTLMSVFRPYHTILLSATLDNGEIRKLTCKPTDEVQIDLVKEHRPGRLHRATVTLRAANPLWQANAATIGTADYATALGQWYYAGGAIGSAQVETAVNNPNASGQNWSGVSATTGDWAIAFVTFYDNTTYVFDSHVWDDAGSASFYRQAGTTLFTANDLTNNTWPGTVGYEAYNYHVIENRSSVTRWWYWTGGSAAIHVSGGGDTNLAADGEWSGKDLGFGAEYAWLPGPITKAMIWTDPTDEQIQSLGPYMLGTAVAGSVSVVNGGDVNAYPVIQLRGPMINPVIVNETIGGTIDLTGLTIPESTTYTLDLRDGRKQIYDSGGVSVLSGPTTTPMGMADFLLAPSPVAAGGTNTISVTPGSVGTNAYMTVQITNEYISL